jgi:hypothetical protein
MSLLLQELVVALLVAACALFSAWRLMSVALRLRVLAALGRVPLFAQRAWLARLRRTTLARQSAACGGCSQADAHQPLKPGAAAPNRTPGALRR